MKKGLIITGIVFAVILAVGFSLYGYINSTRSTAVQLENGLNAQYLANQNELSSYQAGFYEQLGVANLKSDKMDKIISDAVKGRYDGKMAPGTGGAFFSAISEAYPEIGTSLDIYDKIVDYVAAKREAYKQAQNKLLDMLRTYDTWRQDGLLRSFVVANVLGVPSDRLEARIGTDVKRGAEARDRMFLIVITEDARDAYQTGTDKPLMPKPGN